MTFGEDFFVKNMNPPVFTVDLLRTQINSFSHLLGSKIKTQFSQTIFIKIGSTSLKRFLKRNEIKICKLRGRKEMKLRELSAWKGVK